MNGASKILTVSYGTFSCTLEGFDEPFNTMKAIAEYFRDLAAEDRYFGAEPPTPDAAMLHRIAEREIQRRVEARIEDNGVVLRVGDQPPVVQIARPAPVAAPLIAAPLAADAPGIAPDQTDDADATESVSAKLSRLRADRDASERLSGGAVGEALPEVAAAEEAAPEAAAVEAGVAEVAAPEAVAETDPTDIAALDDLPAEVDMALDDLATDPAVAEPVAEPFAAEPAAAEPTDADLTAAEPTDADIARAFEAAQGDDLLAEAVADAGPADDFDMDAFAAGALTDPQDAVSEADDLAEAADLGDDSLLASLGAMIDPGAATVDDAAPLDSPAPLDTDAPLVSAALAHHLPEQDASAGPAELSEADLPKADLPEADLPELEDLDDALFDAPVAADLPAGADDLAAPVAIETVETTEPVEAALPAPTADLANPRLQRARARVIKIRRHDVAAGTQDSQPAAPVLVEPALPTAASLLSAEAEAELQRELAELEAEALPSDVDLDAATADRLPGLDEDVAVDRLMAQTTTEMEVPENKRRLSAIAHLKAAVAATVADRKVNPSGPVADDRSDAYRDDLSRVVRPRRPGGTPTDRPAPLVLVSEQRIDRPRPMTPPEAPPQAASHAAAPIRPRRVRAGAYAVQSLPAAIAEAELEADDLAAQLMDEIEADEIGNIFADSPDMGFADFADRLGAQSMADLLEAAAAYCALILERPNFSRPLLLAQLSRLPEAETFSREDSLRGFGTLLREGRITKIRRGQFMMPEGSRALAEAKRIAG